MALRVWRWERQVGVFFDGLGLQARDVAGDMAVWKSYRGRFLESRWLQARMETGLAGSDALQDPESNPGEPFDVIDLC